MDIPYGLQPAIKKSMSLTHLLSSDDLVQQFTLEILLNLQFASWFEISCNELSIPSSK